MDTSSIFDDLTWNNMLEEILSIGDNGVVPLATPINFQLALYPTGNVKNALG